MMVDGRQAPLGAAAAQRRRLALGGVALGPRNGIAATSPAAAHDRPAMAPLQLLWVGAVDEAARGVLRRLHADLPLQVWLADRAELDPALGARRWDLMLVSLRAALEGPVCVPDLPVTPCARRMLVLSGEALLPHLAIASRYHGVLATDSPAPAGAVLLLGLHGYFVLPARLPRLASPHPLLLLLRRYAGLPERDRLVLRFLAAGASNQAIAADLRMSLPATKARVRTLLARLGLRNRTHAAVSFARCEALFALFGRSG